MTPYELSHKLSESTSLKDLHRDMTNEELMSIVENFIYGEIPEKKLNVVIHNANGLPCSLDKFTINGIEATVYDFGEGSTSGSCMGGGCSHRFHADRVPKREVLHKYGITAEQFAEIGEQLESALYIDGCGWCS